MKKILLTALISSHAMVYSQYKAVEYTYDEFGIKQKTAVYEKEVNGTVTKYEVKDFVRREKTKTYRKNIKGNIEVYEYGEFGIKHKTKEIEDINED